MSDLEEKPKGCRSKHAVRANYSKEGEFLRLCLQQVGRRERPPFRIIQDWRDAFS
jgi:hypothetical protein